MGCGITTQVLDNKDDLSWINLYVGKLGILDGDPKNTNSFGLEYRATKITKWKIIPSFGYSLGANGIKYLYTDVKHDWTIKKNWVFTFSLGTGIFDNNDSLDLGSTIEFRTGFELTYHFNNNNRLGLVAYHLSNSKLSKQNPGTEALMLTFLVPFDTLIKKK